MWKAALNEMNYNSRLWNGDGEGGKHRNVDNHI